MSNSECSVPDSSPSDVEPASSIFYVDTSVALRIVLHRSTSAVDWFNAESSRGSTMLSSSLLRLEMTRVFRRESLAPDPIADFTRSLVLTRVDDSLLTEAAAIRPHIKSLDAIHLASALRVGLGTLTLATHDRNMARVANSLGFDIIDPVSS